MMTHVAPVHSPLAHLERWARAVIRQRIAVLCGWLAVAIIGAVCAARLPALLATSLSVSGSSSEQATQLLARQFHQNPEGTFTVVFVTGKASRATLRAMTNRVATAARQVPGARAAPLQAVAGIVYGNVVTRLDIQGAEAWTDSLRRALRGRAPPALVTGAPAIQHDINPILSGDLRKGELVALPVVLLLLAAVLGFRPLILIPLAFAAGTISAALGIVYGLAHVFLTVSYVPNLVELMGLGLAIDYSLLFVQRFREEAAGEGRSIDDAVVRTTVTAGRAVVFSGAAVAVGLAAVLITPVPFIRSLGVAGVVVPLVSMVAALTLQPALLSLLGPGDLRGPARRSGRETDGERSAGASAGRGVWARLAGVVLRRQPAVLVATAVLLATLAAPALWLQLTPGSLSSVPDVAESARGIALLSGRVGAGALTPLEVVIDSGTSGAARAAAASAATLDLARRLLQDPEVFVVSIGTRPPFVDPSGRYARVEVVGRHEFGAEATQQLVTRLRERLIPAVRFPARSRIWTGGAPAQGVDFLTAVYGSFPWIVLLVLVAAYVVLLRAFRSLLFPLIAVLLDLISIAAAYGMLVLIFQVGGGVPGLAHTSQIEGWVPVLLFAALFGLSMDYQVFLVSRMREAWDSGLGSTAAVTLGLERTGRIVSAAAIIMVASFAGFIAGRVAGLQEFGVGLALGVLLDATVVRLLLMPVLIALLGRWSWWLPAPIASITAKK